MTPQPRVLPSSASLRPLSAAPSIWPWPISASPSNSSSTAPSSRFSPPITPSRCWIAATARASLPRSRWIRTHGRGCFVVLEARQEPLGLLDTTLSQPQLGQPRQGLTAQGGHRVPRQLERFPQLLLGV